MPAWFSLGILKRLEHFHETLSVYQRFYFPFNLYLFISAFLRPFPYLGIFFYKPLGGVSRIFPLNDCFSLKRSIFVCNSSFNPAYYACDLLLLLEGLLPFVSSEIFFLVSSQSFKELIPQVLSTFQFFD